jgi:hypothetical protein
VAAPPVVTVGLFATPVADASPALTRRAGDGLFAVPVPAAELGPVATLEVVLLAVPVAVAVVVTGSILTDGLFAAPVLSATSAGALVVAATMTALASNRCR